MLTLSGEAGERIQVGPNVTITILGTGKKSGQFKFGIDAPQELEVARLDRKTPWIPQAEFARARREKRARKES
jgi:carbon storage regulator CsrA